jgi:hexosaminidase
MRLLIAVVCLSFVALSSSFAQATPELDIMPLPAKVQPGSGQLLIDANFSVALTGAKDSRIQGATERFLERLARQTAIPLKTKIAGSGDAKLVIAATKADEKLLQLGADESYTLEISPTSAKLSAANDLGVLHGLETFLQLVKSSPDGFAVPALRIDDQPRFP